MQVFKMFFKIAKSKLPSAIIYVVIFFIISSVMANYSPAESNFEETKMNICIIDEDNTKASKAFTDYILDGQNEVKINGGKREILDSLYFRNADYVITVKKGYEEKVSKGETNDLFTNYKAPDSSTAVLCDNRVDSYVKTLSASLVGNADLDTALDRTKDAFGDKVKVTKESFSKTNNSDIPSNFSYYYRYQAYIYMAVFSLVLGNILLTLNKKDIKNRVNCSCLPASKQTIGIFAGSTAFVMIIWLIFSIGGLYFADFVINKTVLLYIANSFVYAVVSAALSLFIISFEPSLNVLSMISNVVSLGICFLCGVFVPQYMLGEGVLMAGKFLPAYWYVRANDMIQNVSGVPYSNKEFLQCIGIQLIYALALFAVSAAITKEKHDKKN